MERQRDTTFGDLEGTMNLAIERVRDRQRHRNPTSSQYSAINLPRPELGLCPKSRPPVETTTLLPGTSALPLPTSALVRPDKKGSLLKALGTAPPPPPPPPQA